MTTVSASARPAFVDYSSQTVPAFYICWRCQGTNCKLWHPVDSNHFRGDFVCSGCLGLATHRTSGPPKSVVREIRPDGISRLATLDQVGCLIPVVPLLGSIGIWVYDHIPTEAAAWWHRLPDSPVKP